MTVSPRPLSQQTPPDSTAAAAVDLDPATIWAKVDRMVDGFLALLPNIVIALVVFALFLIGARVLRAVLQRTTRGRRAEHVGLVLGRLAQAAMLFAGLLISVSIVLPTVGGAELIQVLGIGSVAIGFAFRDILQNFVAGLLILLRQPFHVGDQIVYKEFEGTVESIETRATLLKTYDGTRVVIPNGEIYTNALRVNTAYPLRRTQFDVGIGYGDSVREARRVILEAVRAIEGVLEDPAPDVLVVALADSYVTLRPRWWTAPQRAEVLRVQTEVITAVKEALDEAGIDMPFPTQVLLWHDQTETIDGDRTQQREGWPAGTNPPRSRWRSAGRTPLSSGEEIPT